MRPCALRASLSVGVCPEFFRHKVLDANTFFANAAGLQQPHLTRNGFGGTIGGPILKNRTLFFFDFNGIHALTAVTSSLAGVPAAADLQGTGVRADSILPSIIDTEANRKAMPGADFAKWPKPDDVARVILFLASDETKVIHGAAIPVYG
ncbi:MAG: SDR family oxidoreductase [Acidobacteriia bacterium]|nr:SDR family oxidoreductase [Terriglobia bacterium]